MKKTAEDKMADALLKKYEESNKLKKISGKAGGLASFLTGQDEKVILTEDLKFTTLPALYLKLTELYNFYKNKSSYNDNQRHLKMESELCLSYLDKLEDDLILEELRKIKEETERLKTKYGIEI